VRYREASTHAAHTPMRAEHGLEHPHAITHLWVALRRGRRSERAVKSPIPVIVAVAVS
jgi:hypothetical protein